MPVFPLGSLSLSLPLPPSVIIHQLCVSGVITISEQVISPFGP